MKNFTTFLCLLMMISVRVSAQQEKGIIGANSWLNNWTEFTPSKVVYEENTHIIVGNITQDTKLVRTNTYLLEGNVFVTNNAILSIEPGTVIMGDYKTKASLTVTVGASIVAEGTLTEPIVFTSNKTVKKAGDWGGIIILGDGHVNKFGKSSVSSFYSELDASNYQYVNYGGAGEKDNSGFLSYVRIEFAGGKSKISNPSNALLLAGVGKKTTINNVMVSYSAGNSFAVIGGEVNMNQMVSNRSNGNDYDFNYGAVCNINNSLAVRSPYISSSESRCMDAVSYNDINDVDLTKKGTSIIAKNMTFLTDSDNLESDIQLGLINESMYVGDNTSFSIEKSVVSGFKKALILDENIQMNEANLSKIQIKNMYFNNCSGNIFLNYRENNEDLENWYASPSFSNLYSKTKHSELFIDPNPSPNKKPDFRLRINKIIPTNNSSISSRN